MAEGGQDLKFIKRLLKTGIGNYWPKGTYLIVVIKNTGGQVIWNKNYQTSNNHVHTETLMLNDDEFKNNVTGKVDITLTSNYSPCWICAQELIEFYEDNESSIGEFIIRFSRPYRINKTVNRNGLRHLSNAGITLEAMTEKSWLDVIMQSMFDLDPEKVKERDDKAGHELDELLNEDLESESSDSHDEHLVDIFKLFNMSDKSN